MLQSSLVWPCLLALACTHVCDCGDAHAQAPLPSSAGTAEDTFLPCTHKQSPLNELRVDKDIPERSASKEEDDGLYMRRAVHLASMALGRTRPNPAVGCVIVKNRRIIGEGFHPRAGHPHAEVYALQQAGGDAQGATVYVSLEPCNHFGRTPPCTTALIRAGVARVVAGMEDPDPRVAGSGIRRLQSHGIDVRVGVEDRMCKDLNAPFVFRTQFNRSYVVGVYGTPDNTALGIGLCAHCPETDAVIVNMTAHGTVTEVEHLLHHMPSHISLVCLCPSRAHAHSLEQFLHSSEPRTTHRTDKLHVREVLLVHQCERVSDEPHDMFTRDRERIQTSTPDSNSRSEGVAVGTGIRTHTFAIADSSPLTCLARLAQHGLNAVGLFESNPHTLCAMAHSGVLQKLVVLEGSEEEEPLARLLDRSCTYIGLQSTAQISTISALFWRQP